ncbi:FAD-dependent oxidoreductase [Dactylosporangium sp. CA-092794]|uniref:FAD-dependent oxidoreductase n=1 Tax=Dactylosporangium sp. CA-092794 TaxID=3239929 RepID=UPI003D8D85EB
MSKRQGTSAIVIGAGMAGLLTARVLSGHVDRVTILERDRLPEDAATRRGVPQGRHAHALLAAGQRLLDGWFPGLTDELRAKGAVPIDAGELVWHQAGAYRAPTDLGFLALSMSRALLESTIRGRLLRERSNVSVADDTPVDGLILELGRVVGVTVDGAQHRADLVVACSGRNTRFLDQLAGAGFPAPEVSAVHIDVAYATRVGPRRPDDLCGALAVVIDDPAQGHRLGMALPAEGDRWMVTVGSYHGDVPPTEPAEYEDFARSLPSPLIADILDRAGTLTPALTHRLPSSQRRHVERLRRTPPGFVVLGDAICSLNPVHAQGMSSAALQARVLDRTVARYGLTSSALPRVFYRRAARAVDVPWRIASRCDFADPRTTGPKPPGTDLLNRYLRKVLLACHTSVPVSRRMLRVQHLLARPASLFTPAMVVRVLLAARRSAAVATIAANRE